MKEDMEEKGRDRKPRGIGNNIEGRWGTRYVF